MYEFKYQKPNSVRQAANMLAKDSEAKDLAIPTTMPLLRILRTATTPDGTVVEVNDTRMSSERFEIGHPITRDATAARPAIG